MNRRLTHSPPAAMAHLSNYSTAFQGLSARTSVPLAAGARMPAFSTI